MIRYHHEKKIRKTMCVRNAILALFDYVSRAHEIEICLSSVRPSVRRPFVLQLSLNLMHGCLSNFGCCFPWAIRWGWFLEKYIYIYFFRIVFVFKNMHATICGRKLKNSTPPTNRIRMFSSFSWIFFLMVLAKLRLRFLKFWKLK